MKRDNEIIFKILYFLFYVNLIAASITLADPATNGLQVSTPGLELTRSESIESLVAKLEKAGTQKETLALISKIETIGNSLGVDRLIEYYHKLPPRVVTYDTDDVVKRSLFYAMVPKLSSQQRRIFASEVIGAEISELRKYFNGRSRPCLYPDRLLREAIKLSESNHMDDTTYKLLSNLSTDQSLPDGAREACMAVVIWRDLAENGKSSSDNIKNILEIIPMFPGGIIPWTIYNEREKRIAYGKSRESLTDVEVFMQWRLSEQDILYEAYMSVLSRYGVIAVECIADTLEQGNIIKKRRDFLAMVAASLLSKMGKSINGDKMRLLLTKIENYVDKMDDLGMGCYRNIAIIELNGLYARSGITNYHKFKEGGDVFATISRGGADEPLVTNAVSLSCNSTTNNMLKVILKTGLPNAHSIRLMLITLAGILLLILALLKTFKKGRRGN